jgi:hypothetical protein
VRFENAGRLQIELFLLRLAGVLAGGSAVGGGGIDQRDSRALALEQLGQGYDYDIVTVMAIIGQTLVSSHPNADFTEAL